MDCLLLIPLLLYSWAIAWIRTLALTTTLPDDALSPIRIEERRTALVFWFTMSKVRPTEVAAEDTSGAPVVTPDVVTLEKLQLCPLAPPSRARMSRARAPFIAAGPLSPGPHTGNRAVVLARVKGSTSRRLDLAF